MYKKKTYDPYWIINSIFDINSVIRTEKIITPKRIRADVIDVINLFDALETRKIEIIAISEGNLPLHGENVFVRIAISFSFLDSIIRHPITPQALQP